MKREEEIRLNSTWSVNKKLLPERQENVRENGNILDEIQP